MPRPRRKKEEAPPAAPWQPPSARVSANALVRLSSDIKEAREAAYDLAYDGNDPCEVLVQTRKARRLIMRDIQATQTNPDLRLDSQHRTRLGAYRLFLHSMVLAPALFSYGSDNKEARTARRITMGYHPAVVALAGEAARRTALHSRNADGRPNATREAALLAIGTRSLNLDGQIMPALTTDFDQTSHAEYFTFGAQEQVQHTDIDVAYIGEGKTPKPGTAVVTALNLGLVADTPPWKAPRNNQTIHALEGALLWQQTPTYNQDRGVMLTNSGGLDQVQTAVFTILHQNLVDYNPGPQ